MKLDDSTRRSLRTAYQFLLSMTLTIPTLLEFLPKGSNLALQLGVVLGFLTAVVKIVNTLEDKGLIPAWFKAPASDGQNPKPVAQPL